MRKDLVMYNDPARNRQAPKYWTIYKWKSSYKTLNGQLLAGPVRR